MDNNDSTKPQQTGGLKLMTVFIAVLALHVLVIGGFTVYHLMGSGSTDTDLTLDKTHKVKVDGTATADGTAPDATTGDRSTDATATTAATTDTAGTSGTTTPSASPADATATTATGTTTPSPTTVAGNAPIAPAPPANSAGPTPLVISNADMAKASGIAPGLLPPPDATSGVTIGAPVSTPPVATAAIRTPASTPAVASATPASSSTPEPSIASAPSVAPVSEPAPPITPATSGPIMADNSVASGPVHMPVIVPKPGSMSAVASTEEHKAPAMHEAKKEIYTVKITDSYKKIAHAHHISVAQLKEANHIKGDVLHTGEKLIIPAEKTSLVKNEASPEVGTPSRVVLDDSTASLSAAPAPGATEHHHRTYTVTKGDTLKYIAKKFDVTTLALKEANNLSSAKLKVGEKLRIPSKEERSAGTSVPTQAQPSQVETQPAPIAPVVQPAPVEATAPQPTPASNPELANLTF
jgi:LysM repeat protein